MAVDPGQVERSERRGMSRRQMIKAAGIAGAAAWTAPVIIDSLSSPAAAFSNCHKKYLKLTFDASGNWTGCLHFTPQCTGQDSTDTNLCPSDSMPSGFPNPTTSGGNVTITLPTGCAFDKTKFTSNWSVQGNYNADSCGSGTPDHCSNNDPADNATTASVATSYSGIKLCYVYLQFCCGS